MGLIFSCIFGGLTTIATADEVQLGLRVPDGFEVTEFADHTLANDIYSLTIDPRGRVVVSGRGYVRILVDDDRDGRAERALPFADGPADGAMGMLWEGASLFVTGDGGLRRYRDEDGNDRADGPSELIRAIKTGGEHDAHAIRRGPDGWLYVIVGNFTGVDASYAELPTSPIKQPIAGCVLRFSPDLKASEIFADGLRNAYDMDFNLDGELFTYDSDNERCVSLPWYEPTRFYHVVPGGHHGWRAPQRGAWWRFPPYFFDGVAPVAYLHRGSPTGVVCYRHRMFPVKHHGGMFALDWTFGRIYFLALDRIGSTYTSTPEVFAESVGDNGFAPTDIVVHPDSGDLYVSVGGRGTRGAVYRIRYRGKSDGPSKEPQAALKVASSPLAQAAKNLQSALAQTASNDALERLRALNQMLRERDRFSDSEVETAVRRNWDRPDRYVRRTTAKLIASLPAARRRDLGSQASTPRQRVTFGWGVYQDQPREAARGVLHLIGDAEVATAQRMECVRLIQKVVGGISAPRYQNMVWEGYSRRSEPDDEGQDLAGRVALVGPALRQAFPSGEADLDRELSRSLALIEDDASKSLAEIAVMLTEESHPVDDLHYLIVLSRLRGPRSDAITETVSRALLSLDRKIEERELNRDRHWSLRVSELHRELARKDPDLNAAMLASEEFGRPDHVLFAENEGFDRRRAAERFLGLAADDEYVWTPELVRLIGLVRTSKALDLIRSRWDDVTLQSAILDVLADGPELEDRERFLVGLSSPQIDTVSRAVAALDSLPPVSDGAEILPVIQALRRWKGEEKQEAGLQDALRSYLERVAERERAELDAEGWSAWFVETYPDHAGKLAAADGIDADAWNERLTGIDWTAGDADRGKVVYAKAACAACHSSSRALGPDLRGVTSRFSRRDLFTALLQPNRDVPPRYQTTLVVTDDGKPYQGAIIYQAVDGIILQTGPTETVRIPGEQIESQQSIPRSLMPAGLLDPLSDGELADLYAYLRSLPQ